MDYLTKFGLGTKESYLFDKADIVEYQDNFRDILQQATRVLGKDGGISVYGLGRGPAEVGNVRVTYLIESATESLLSDQMLAIGQMAYWGQRRLFKVHRNGNVMWTWAMMSSNQQPQVARRMPHLRQQVQMTFQCPETKWYSKPGMVFFDDGATFGDGVVFPAVRVEKQAVSDGDTVTVVNNGNAPVGCRIRWEGNGVDSFSNPSITRRNWANQVVNQLTYSETVSANEIVDIDTGALSCSDYFNLDKVSADWLTIPPGSWDLEIGGTFTTTGLLTIDFWDGYV